MRAVDETLVAHVLHQFQHRVPETVDIGEDHRLGMAAELRPGHDLDDLLQRADTARQCHEGIGALEHHMFALMHVLGDDKLVQLSERMARRLHIDQKFRYDAGHFAAIGKNAAGNCAHDALGAAAIDEANAVFGNGFPKRAARFHMGRITSGLGAAINADGSNRCIFVRHEGKELCAMRHVKKIWEIPCKYGLLATRRLSGAR